MRVYYTPIVNVFIKCCCEIMKYCATKGFSLSLFFFFYSDLVFYAAHITFDIFSFHNFTNL